MSFIQCCRFFPVYQSGRSMKLITFFSSGMAQHFDLFLRCKIWGYDCDEYEDCSIPVLSFWNLPHSTSACHCSLDSRILGYWILYTTYAQIQSGKSIGWLNSSILLRRPIILVPHYGTYCMPPFWHLEFKVATTSFAEFMQPLSNTTVSKKGKFIFTLPLKYWSWYDKLFWIEFFGASGIHNF